MLLATRQVITNGGTPWAPGRRRIRKRRSIRLGDGADGRVVHRAGEARDRAHREDTLTPGAERSAAKRRPGFHRAKSISTTPSQPRSGRDLSPHPAVTPRPSCRTISPPGSPLALSPPDADLITAAIAAVQRIADDSELNAE
jgi:hypothetical protein